MSTRVNCKNFFLTGQKLSSSDRMGQIQSVYAAPNPPLRDCNSSLYVYRMSRHRRPEGGARPSQEWWREQLMSRAAAEKTGINGFTSGGGGTGNMVPAQEGTLRNDSPGSEQVGISDDKIG